LTLSRKLLIGGVAALLIGALVLVLRPHAKGENAATAGGPAEVWEYFSDHSAIGDLAIGADGTIYAGSQTAVLALNPDGSLRWKSPANTARLPVIGRDGSIFASSSWGLIFGFSSEGAMDWKPGYGLIGFSVPPAIGEGGVLYYVNTVGDIYAFSPHGSAPIWSLSTVRPNMMNPTYILPGNDRADGSMRAAAVVENNGMIVVPRSHWLHEFSSEGHQAWILEMTSGHLGPAALGKNGTIYLGDDEHKVFAVDRSGEKMWEFDADESIEGSPVIDTDGNIYFNTSRVVYGLKPDGSLKWQTQTIHNFRTGPTLAADGTIYIGAVDGMNAFNNDGSEKWWFHMKMVGSAPTIGADGTIYAECGIFWVCAVKDGGSPLMQSSWPKQQHDPANTGNVSTIF
jgi:outer membrane protein assembly factor BamB